MRTSHIPCDTPLCVPEMGQESNNFDPNAGNASQSAFRQLQFFEHLNRDVRNLIYSYLACATLLQHVDKERIRSGFASTCRQAKAEVDEEGRRQVRMFMREAMDQYSRETGNEIRLSKHFMIRNDLLRITELTIIVYATRPRLYIYPPPCLFDLLSLSQNKATIHCLGPRLIPILVMQGMMRWFHWIRSDIFYLHKYLNLNDVTISWDCRDQRQREKLTATRLDLVKSDKVALSRQFPHEDFENWPYITRANGGHEVGFFHINISSRSPVVRRGFGSYMGMCHSARLILRESTFQVEFQPCEE